jgi:hypothetical protein
MSEIKSKGEIIVEMLCDGKSLKKIMAELEIPYTRIDVLMRNVRDGAGLPYDKRFYKARKNDILANIEKWKEHRKRLKEIEQEYRATLVDFDF